MKIFQLPKKDNAPKSTTVVRLRRSYYTDSCGGVHLDLTLRTLARKSSGFFDILTEEVSQAGEEYALERIINLQESPDGIYILDVCNPSYDWETMYCDDYDLNLIEYKEK